MSRPAAMALVLVRAGNGSSLVVVVGDEVCATWTDRFMWVTGY